MSQTEAPTLSRIGPILERLHRLHPRLIDLSLGRLEHLLDRIGHPERHLPPVIHVAGTNGKGSTCAFLRAIAEAAGLRVHVYTSPHLVRFNERIRLGGRLVSDEALARALEELERVNAGAPITVFEMVTAVAFHLFAATPADLCVLEVGLGGRFDATNVIDRPAACAITSISLDHQDFLGERLAQIAGEKAGIMKPGASVVTGAQVAEAEDVLVGKARGLGVLLKRRGHDWDVTPTPQGFRFTDAAGVLDLPPPALPGSHQLDNAGIAVAALRASGLAMPDAAFQRGVAAVDWPARLQRLSGRLAGTLPSGWELWLDGGHNAGAGQVLAQHLRAWRDRPLHLIVGMKQAKDAAEFLRPLLPHASTIWAVMEPEQYLAMPVAAIIAASGGMARQGPTVTEALRALPRGDTPARVLICGSLYLAGEILRRDGVEPR